MTEKNVKLLLKFVKNVVKLSDNASDFRIQASYKVYVHETLLPGWLITADWRKGKKWKECSVYLED